MHRGGFRGRGGPNRNRRYFNDRQEGDESNERKKNGPPPGLRGKEIGLWYARRGKSRKEKIDISKRSVVTLNKKHEEEIKSLLRSGSEAAHEFKSAGAQGSSCSVQPSSLYSVSDSNSSSPVSPSNVSLDIKICSEPSTPDFVPFQQKLLVCDSFKAPRQQAEFSYTEHHISTLVSDENMDEKLYNELLEKKKMAEYRKMLEFRQKLPSYHKREELLKLMREKQVLVISGETGCGKTTQVAQFILDDTILRKKGSTCHVICTQPRRISAISVAERVAAERAEGIGRSAGYQIRLESKQPRDTGSILYCTTGILLRRMVSDPYIKSASHIILDEIHERDLMTDFLMIIIKDLLPRRRDLKVILMSATLNAEMFSEYFDNCPMLHIPGYTFPVKELYLEEVLDTIRYIVPSGRQNSSRKGDWKVRQQKQEEEEQFRQYCHSLHGKHSGSTISSLLELNFDEIDYNMVFHLVSHICTHLGDGAILIFMPGWDQISKLHDLFMKSPVHNSRNFIIIPLHSMMPTTNQREVFERPPLGVRKIIISTMIAETSITIDDVVFVIDSGKSKEKTYDVENDTACLQVQWVSKASAKQRRGRAGRVQAGHCFHLFTNYHNEQLVEYQLPEMLRTPLESLCLQIKMLHLGEIQQFLQKAMQPPDEKAVANAIFSLKRMRALDENENLTALGYHLAKLPVVPKVGRMILFAAIFSCLDPVLTVAASLDFKEPFYIPIHKEKVADEKKMQLSRGSKSDHIMLINAFKGWEEAKRHSNDHQYCWNYFLSTNVLKMIANMKRQFAQLLFDIGFTSSPESKHPDSNVHSDNTNLVKAVICAGLYPNVAKLIYTNNRGKRPPKIEALGFGKANIHPKSVNCEVKEFESQWLIYHEKMRTTKLYLYDSTMISPLPLLFFGGNIRVYQEDGRDTIEVDDGIKFHSPTRYAQLVKDLRKELDQLLQKKIEQPSMELIVGHMAESRDQKILKKIIELISTEEIKNKDHSGYK